MSLIKVDEGFVGDLDFLEERMAITQVAAIRVHWPFSL